MNDSPVVNVRSNHCELVDVSSVMLFPSGLAGKLRSLPNSNDAKAGNVRNRTQSNTRVIFIIDTVQEDNDSIIVVGRLLPITRGSEL